MKPRKPKTDIGKVLVCRAYIDKQTNKEWMKKDKLFTQKYRKTQQRHLVLLLPIPFQQHTHLILMTTL